MGRKKFRNITIDGDDSWAWALIWLGHCYGLKIWKKRKLVYETVFGGECSRCKDFPITPSLITRFIKRYLT